MDQRISQTKGRWALTALVATAALTAMGCGQTGEEDQAGGAEVRVHALAVESITSASLTVSGDALPKPRTEALSKSNGQWGATLGGLPAAKGYTFTANAVALDGTVYSGSTSNVEIVAKQTVAVQIVASTSSKAFKNAAPVIDSVTISSTNVAPATVVNLAVVAHDPDVGDTLTYTWTSTAADGFANAAAASTTWTAPVSEGAYDVTITVEDSHGAKASTTAKVKVSASNGRGTAGVAVTFNSAPVVSSVVATPGWLEKGVATALVVQASDADANTLSYTWTSACAGNFGGNAATTTFTLADLETASACTLTVGVSDGTGFVTTGEVTLPTSKPSFVAGPEIVSSLQSAVFVNAGDVVDLSVEALDPQGSALTFAWTAPAGALSAPTSTGTTSQVAWTAPPTGAPWTVTATVTDSLGLSTQQVFTVKMGLCTTAPAPTSTAWKFGVMADTQWIGTDDGKNPNSVAVSIINALNTEFVAKGVDLVVQVGDLTDSGNTVALQTTAVFRQALYNAGIGFFPLRGNHESSTLAASDFKTVFPQTQTGLMNATPAAAFTASATPDYPTLPPVIGSPFTMGTNFSSPPAPLTGLTYAFDYKNVRMVLLDQFMKQDGTSASGNYALDPQLPWISSTLAGKPAGSHSFVFSHKGLITENHTDVLFGSNPSVDPTGVDTFINAMAATQTHYLMIGHDHMYDRSIIGTALTGTGIIQQVLCASDSSKFYIPYGPNYPATGNKVTNDDKYDVAAFGKKRQTQLAQELYTVGYYIVTVDGPRVKVDYYSTVVNPTYSSGEYLMTTFPSPSFSKRDTFGYALNGKEFVVPSAGSYGAVSDTYAGATLKMGGNNAGTTTDSANRSLSKAVDTGWADGTCATASPIATVVGSTSPMYGAADARLVALTFDPNRVGDGQIASGHFGLAVRDSSGNWVNAASTGTPSFVLGAADAAAPLGTYGIDVATHTAWAVVDHDGDFAVAMF